MVLITETWLHCGIQNDVIIPPGYKMFRKDRDSRGGGVCIRIKNSVHAALIDSGIPETVWCRISFQSVVYLVGAIYRPPSTSLDMLNQLSTFLCNNVHRNTQLIMAGDFNLPYINWQDLTCSGFEASSVDKLLDVMFSFNLNQIVQDDTRITSRPRSLLDLVFLSNNTENHLLTIEDGISDHKIIVVNVTASNMLHKKYSTVIAIKDYKRADDNSILDFLELSFGQFEHHAKEKSVDEQCNEFKDVVNHCVDRFVPTQKKKMSKQRRPWITRGIIHMKRKLKRLRKKKKGLGRNSETVQN